MSAWLLPLLCPNLRTWLHNKGVDSTINTEICFVYNIQEFLQLSYELLNPAVVDLWLCGHFALQIVCIRIIICPPCVFTMHTWQNQHSTYHFMVLTSKQAIDVIIKTKCKNSILSIEVFSRSPSKYISYITPSQNLLQLSNGSFTYLKTSANTFISSRICSKRFFTGNLTTK